MSTFEDIAFFPYPDSPLPYSIEMAGRSYCDETYRIRRNPSTVYVFEYVVRGTGTVHHNDAVFYPKEGDVYILKPDFRHDYRSDAKNPWEKIWFNVRGDLVERLLDAYSLTYTSLFPQFKDSSLFEEFLGIAKDRSLSHRQIFEQTSVVLFRLVQQLYNSYYSPNPKQSEAAKIKKYIDQHLDRMIAIEELSELIFRSSSRVIKIFKEAYGQTPYDYALKRKLEMAQLLLKNSNMTVREISDKIGFCDEHYFSNFFKRKCGMSPKVYRQN